MLTKKESECGEREDEGARDVLIKGNSEGLDQIILHNLVREDTAFETEKMGLTCPQRPIPVVEDQSVAAKAVHSDHGGDEEEEEESVYVQGSPCDEAQHGDTARLNPAGGGRLGDVMILSAD